MIHTGDEFTGCGSNFFRRYVPSRTPANAKVHCERRVQAPPCCSVYGFKDEVDVIARHDTESGLC